MARIFNGGKKKLLKKRPLNIIEAIQHHFCEWHTEIFSMAKNAWCQTVSTTDKPIEPRAIIDLIMVERESFIVFVP